MKNIQKFKLFVEAVVIIAITLALVLPSSAVNTNTVIGKGNQKTPLMNGAQSWILKSMKASDGGYHPHAFSAGEDIKVSAETYPAGGDDTMPAIAIDDKDNIVITWTNYNTETGYNLGLTYSSYPVTEEGVQSHWVIFEGLSGGAEVNDLYCSDIALIRGPLETDYEGLYGVFIGVDVGAEVAGNYMIPDITADPSDPAYATFATWLNGAPEATYASVVDSGYYHEPNSDYDGPVNMYIYYFGESGYDIPDCPVYVNNNLRGGEGAESTFYFDAQTHLDTAPASDPDMACLENRFHLTWQYHNATLDKDQIVWKKIDPAVEADIEYTPFQKYVGFGTHPAIAGENSGKIAIVYMTSEGKVNCTYSGDDGESWSTVMVATGTYPDLYFREGKFYATYIDAGNLFIVNSTDGAAWGTPTRINDVDGTVVAEENSVDLHEGGVVWVDSRGETDQVYYQGLFVPAAKPDLVLSINSGIGLGVSADITNNGDAAATNVSWQIKVIGGPFDRVLKDKTGTIESIAAGATETVSTGMFFGLGKIAITANVDCDEGSSAQDTGDGFQFFIITIVN